MTCLRLCLVLASVLPLATWLAGCTDVQNQPNGYQTSTGRPGSLPPGGYPPAAVSSPAVATQATTAPAVPGGGVQATINGFTRGVTTYDQAVAALGQPVSSTSQPDGYRLAAWRDPSQASPGGMAQGGGLLGQGLSTLGSSGRLGTYGSMATSMLPQLQGMAGQATPTQGAAGQATGGTYDLLFDRAGVFQGVNARAPASTSRGIDPSQLLRFLPGRS